MCSLTGRRRGAECTAGLGTEGGGGVSDSPAEGAPSPLLERIRPEGPESVGGGEVPGVSESPWATAGRGKHGGTQAGGPTCCGPSPREHGA